MPSGRTGLPVSLMVIIATLAVLAFVPFILPQMAYTFAIIFPFAILAASWDLLYGYTGATSLGHVFPFGVGAFAAGLISRLPAPFIFLVAGAAGATLNLAVAGAALRVKGPYFAITTLATTLIAERTAIILWGEEGLYNVEPLLGGSFIGGYYVGLTLLGVSVLVMLWVAQSKVGLKLKAIRDDELAASTVGISVLRYKIASFLISSFFAGVAGGFYAIFVAHVNHSVFAIGSSFQVLSMAIFGGLGTILGPVFGAFIIGFVSLFYANYGAYTLLLQGLLVMLVLALTPRGLVGLIVGLTKRLGLVRK